MYTFAVLWRKRHKPNGLNVRTAVNAIFLQVGGLHVAAKVAAINLSLFAFTDEAASWDNLHERFEVKRINHQEAYSLDGASTNWAEEYFSRLRRAEIGIHHHIAGAYLLRYAQESSWRE